MSEEKKNKANETVESGADMSREEYRRRLEEAERRAQVAESDAAILRECIVRLTLERTGLLR